MTELREEELPESEAVSLSQEEEEEAMDEWETDDGMEGA